jgi:hypothetical protein
LAFAWFGGVFRRLRYDNLKSAVKKILRGQRREETERFIAFQSHWGFAAEFCTPGEVHEKGGVEGEGGYFRRNHLVPVPRVKDLAELNAHLLASCQEDGKPIIGERTETAAVLMLREREHLGPLAKEKFDLAEVSFPEVDGGGCVAVRTNRYSTPLRPGIKPEVKVYPAYVEVWHEGRRVARHERCYSRRQQILDLEHYLEPLSRKPGALAGGTRLMVEVLGLGREHGYDRLEKAIERALALGCSDAEAIRYLLLESRLERKPPEAVSSSRAISPMSTSVTCR